MHSIENRKAVGRLKEGSYCLLRATEIIFFLISTINLEQKDKSSTISYYHRNIANILNFLVCLFILMGHIFNCGFQSS